MKHTSCVDRHIRWLLLCAGVGVLAPAPARAELVRFDFRGAVSDNTGDLGVFGPFSSVSLGDIITGHISFEAGPGNPDQDPGDPDAGVYTLLEFVIDQAVVAIAPDGVGILRVPPVPVLDPLPPDVGRDLFAAVGRFDIGGDGYVVSLALEAPYGAVFSGDALPASLSLADFTEARRVRAIRTIGLGSFPSQIDEAELVSLTAVPEPSSVVLLSVGLCGFAWLRRRVSGHD
jgi:hypothetical protein